MEKIIAFCGEVCTDCPAFIATKNNDNDKRRETAELWSKKYNHDFKLEDINCDGCLSRTGRVIGYSNICEIRKCGREKGVENCAYCGEYICETLAKFFDIVPANKATLDKIRQGL